MVSSLSFKNPLYLFVYFWLCCALAVLHRLSLVVVSRGYYSLWCMTPHCGGFSFSSLQALEQGFSSCGTWA